MSKLSGLSTLSVRKNNGLKPIRNMLGSNYFATHILSTKATDGSGGAPAPSIATLAALTLFDASDLTLSTGQSLEVMG